MLGCAEQHQALSQMLVPNSQNGSEQGEEVSSGSFLLSLQKISAQPTGES